MKRLFYGSSVIAAMLAAWACGGMDTEGIDETDELSADPAIVFLANTDSEAVFVEALNANGEQLDANFQVGTVGTCLVVTRDTTFAPQSGINTDQTTRARFVVKTTDPACFATTSFSITGNGKTVEIPVRITPSSVPVAISNAAPALGEPVTLTAPANVRFTPGSTVTAGSIAGIVTGISADSSELTVLFPPNVTDQTLAVDSVVVSYLPGQFFTAPTGSLLNTPALTTFTGTFSTLAPNVNQLVTLTVPGYKFLPDAVVVIGADVQTITAISADSGTVTFRAHKPIGPDSVQVRNIVLANLLQVPLALKSTSLMTVGTSVSSLSGTNSFASAPPVQAPPSGLTGGVVDVGGFASGLPECQGFTCRIYRIDLTADQSITINASWSTVTDIGIYLFDEALAGPTNIGCDANGAGTGNAETCTADLTAGTWYLVAIDFSAAYPPPDNVPASWVQRSSRRGKYSTACSMIGLDPSRSRRWGHAPMRRFCATVSSGKT